MNTYLINPRMRNSFIVLLIIVILFTVSSFLILNIHYNDLKEDYIDSFGNVLNIVSESDPELAGDILASIRRGIGSEQREEARETLEEYGITVDLESSLFPNISENYRRNNIMIIGFSSVLLLVLFVFNYMNNRYFYKKIRKITERAKKIIEGEFKTFPEEEGKGDFPKLISSFNAMAYIIKDNLDDLKKEKHFLIDLLSDISHQLKTPLSSMIVYNDILIDKELPREKQVVFLENNKKQLERIEWLIKSLLKLARLDARAIDFKKEYSNLTYTIKSAIESLDERISQKEINVNFDMKDELYLAHDFFWIKEALINLLVNAIDHSHRGESINIGVIETPIYNKIEIEDFGDGIYEEDISHIFKRFYKNKDSKNDSVGIGLALSKSIIEGHDGLIEVESERDKGSKFIVTFFKY